MSIIKHTLHYHNRIILHTCKRVGDVLGNVKNLFVLCSDDNLKEIQTVAKNKYNFKDDLSIIQVTAITKISKLNTSNIFKQNQT